jgi:hypothetical protein
MRRISRVQALTVLAFSISVTGWRACAQDAAPVVKSGSAEQSDAGLGRPARSGSHHKVASRDTKEKPPAAPPPWQAVDPDRVQQPAGSAAAPQGHTSVERHIGSDDLITLGGKWNGANDTAEKTRVENYNADALGSGGEMGFKLHF